MTVSGRFLCVDRGLLLVEPTHFKGGQHHVLKVNSRGCVRFARHRVYLSETMIGEYIEFRPNPVEDSFAACYRNFKIAEFSAIDGKLLNRKISRM